MIPVEIEQRKPVLIPVIKHVSPVNLMVEVMEAVIDLDAVDEFCRQLIDDVEKTRND